MGTGNAVDKNGEKNHEVHSWVKALGFSQIITQVHIRFELNQTRVERFMVVWEHALFLN